MKKRKVTTAAFLAGVTTLAVSLPAMAETRGYDGATDKSAVSQVMTDGYIYGEDFHWIDDETDAS